MTASNSSPTTSETDEAWWGCADGDEFPTREAALEHCRMVCPDETTKVRVRRITFGPWEWEDA